jgi:cell division septal protein FtsQ
MKARATPARNQRNSSRKQRKQQHLLDVKVRSRAATRQRNRRALVWLSTVFLFCGAIGGIVYGSREALRRFFWQNPDYNLAEVAIHSDGPLTREQIIEATDIHEGRNIFTINLSAARKGLMALPQVDRAEIERILPNKITIDVTERKPVAWVAAKDDGDPSSDPGAFLIDHSGILLRLRGQVAEYYHLPVITGLAVDNYEAGETVDLPEVAAALQLIKLTGENPSRYQVRSIDVSKGYCMIVTDERHAKITFPLDDIEAQLDRLARLFANVDASKQEIQTVNLMVQRNVPVTFVPPPEPDAITDAEAIAAPSPSPAAAAQPAPGAAAKKVPREQFFSTTKHTQSTRKPLTMTSSLHHPHSSPTPMVRRAVPLSAFDTQP